MTEIVPTIRIEEANSGYIVHGNDSRITLTDDDVLVLSQSIQPLRDRILTKRNRSATGLPMIVLNTVTRIGVGESSFGELFLTMISDEGDLSYLLSLETARGLILKLSEKVAALEARNPTKQ